MSDPRRIWESELGEKGRAALRAARKIEPPPGLHDDVWNALFGALPPGGGLGSSKAGATGAPAAAVGGAKAGLTFVKALVIGATFGGAAVGLHRAARLVWSPDRAPPVTRAAAGSTAPAITSSAEVQVDAPSESSARLPLAELQASAIGKGARHGSRARRFQEPNAAHADDRTSEQTGPSERTSDEPGRSAASASSDVSEESRMIADAREALRSGNSQAAIAWLERARARYPDGVLVQEREALWIEALVAAGQRDAAAERARVFVRNWPESPYAARVRALTAHP